MIRALIALVAAALALLAGAGWWAFLIGAAVALMLTVFAGPGAVWRPGAGGAARGGGPFDW